MHGAALRAADLWLVEQQLVDEARKPLPSLGLPVQRSGAGPCERVVLRFPAGLGRPPRAFDPSPVLEANERDVQGSLVQRERMVGELIETGGEAVGVLRPHRRERPKHDQIERPLQQLHARTIFTGHSSGVERALHWYVKWSDQAGPELPKVQRLRSRPVREPATNGGNNQRKEGGRKDGASKAGVEQEQVGQNRADHRAAQEGCAK